MRILTVLKQTPDSTATIKPSADGSGIETKGLKFVMNPFDEFAVEQAVQLREKGQDVEEIVALAIGGEKVAEVLRPALAMGADRGIEISDPALNTHDELLLAEVAAAAIKSLPQQFDLILTGKSAIDMDAWELGAALAEALELPHIGAAQELIDVTDGTFKAFRRVEGAQESMSCSFPLLVTCEKGLVEPRYPSLPNLMKAKKKPVDKLALADIAGASDLLAGRSELVSIEAPTASSGCQFIEGEPEEMAKELVRRLREEAKVI